MAIDKRADDDNGSEDAPEPIVPCTEAVAKASAGKLVADSRGKLMSPYEITDTAGQRADDKGKEPEVHGFLSIVSAANDIGVLRDMCIYDKSIDTEGNKRKQEELSKSSVRSELCDR